MRTRSQRDRRTVDEGPLERLGQQRLAVVLGQASRARAVRRKERHRSSVSESSRPNKGRRLTLNGPVNFSPVMNGCRRACEGDHRLIGSMLSRPKQKSVNEDRIAISAKPKREELQFSRRQLAR